MLALIYRTFPAMSEVYFRRFWLSQWVALIGLWMQLTAQQWLVYSLTGSPLLLGLLGVAQFGPIMLFFIAGRCCGGSYRQTFPRSFYTGGLFRASAPACIARFYRLGQLL